MKLRKSARDANHMANQPVPEANAAEVLPLDTAVTQEKNVVYRGPQNRVWRLAAAALLACELVSVPTTSTAASQANVAVASQAKLPAHIPEMASAPEQQVMPAGPGPGSKMPPTADCQGTILFGDVCYDWAGAYQKDNGQFRAKGISVDMYQANPTIGNDPTIANHSIDEIYAASADQKQAVEFGWYKDSGDSSPVLFGTHWVNHKFAGYASFGSQGYESAQNWMDLGSKVAVGQLGKYAITFQDNTWELVYDGVEVGGFPETDWTDNNASFTELGWTAIYGEVAEGLSTSGRTMMGDGNLSDNTGTPTFSHYTLYGSNANAYFANFYGDAAPQNYNISDETPSSMYTGGPGYLQTSPIGV